MRKLFPVKPLSILLITAFILLISPFGKADAQLPSKIRIRLFEAYPNIQAITLQGSFKLIQPFQRSFSRQTYHISIQNRQLCLTRFHDPKPLLQAGRIILTASEGNSVTLQTGHLAPRRYPGRLEINVQTPNQIRIINQLPARQYVMLVVGSETPSPWPLEALKAQAVLTQSRLHQYHPGDELGDSTQQEAYLGSAYFKPDVEKAVNQVWNTVLTYQNHPISPFYHASCAGHTSDGRLFSPQNPAAWLTGIKCPYCGQSPFTRTTVRILPRTMIENSPLRAELLGAAPPRIIATDSASRPLLVRLANGKSISGYELWLKIGQTFGWDKAPGTRFQIRQQANGDIQIQSTGAGHGIGLCQWGAAGMAQQGKSYREILRFYFPKAHVTPI